MIVEAKAKYQGRSKDSIYTNHQAPKIMDPPSLGAEAISAKAAGEVC